MEYTSTPGARAAPSAIMREPSASAVSWAAVFAGAAIAAALSLALLAGGAGFGFLSMSPWGDEGASAVTLGVAAILWMMFTQIAAYGMGGYVAGRLRTRWVDVQRDEIYFRDTAHGLLVWAVSVVVSAVLLGSTLASLTGTAARVGASAVQGVASAATTAAANGEDQANPASEYFVDMMFRTEQPAPAADPQAARAEVARIVGQSAVAGDMTQEDRTYVARVVAAQTEMDQAAAQARVDEILTRAQQTADEAETAAREAADTTRKAAAAFALWAFASMLIGAFVAAWMAAVGGRSARAP